MSPVNNGFSAILRHIENSDAFITSVAAELDDGMLSPGGSVVVGVSGGADSMAMLAAMAFLAKQPGRKYHVIAAHLNHSLRDQAHLDEKFVRDCCAQLDLPCVCETVDTKLTAAELGEGVEHAGRELRYRFFRKTAVAFGAGSVALAHHADDNIETALFRMFRGSGLRGISGIAPRRELSADPKIEIIRPLLAVSRASIIEFCRRCRIPWREDHTNEDTTYSRNFIRHELLAMLENRFGPDVRSAVSRLIAQARKADEYISRQARELLECATAYENDERILLDMKIFSAGEEIIRTTALRTAAEKLNIPQRDLTSEHIMNMDVIANGECVNLPGNFRAIRRKDILVIEKH